jgi:hypothetical protein
MEAAALATGGVNLQVRRVGDSGVVLAHTRDVEDLSVALTKVVCPLRLLACVMDLSSEAKGHVEQGHDAHLCLYEGFTL